MICAYSVMALMEFGSRWSKGFSKHLLPIRTSSLSFTCGVSPISKAPEFAFYHPLRAALAALCFTNTEVLGLSTVTSFEPILSFPKSEEAKAM